MFNNKHLFTPNNEIHKYNTRNNNNLYPALANLTKFNKGPYISGIKVFNHLTQYLKTLDPTCFGTVPKHLGVIIIVMNCILLSAFVRGYIDWKNVHGMNNTKFAYGGVKVIA
jgi:hypothetical protein